MPRFRYADLPSLDHVALAWLAKNRLPIQIGQVEGAQRALEIAISALPVSLRPAAATWRSVRRAYCTATGRQDPRDGLHQVGFWASWLAAQRLAPGDRLTSLAGIALREALALVASPFNGIVTPPDQQVWRRHGWAGVANTAKALVLTTLPNGAILIDIVATRPRQALRARNNEKRRQAYQSLSADERGHLMARAAQKRLRALGRAGELSERLRANRAV